MRLLCFVNILFITFSYFDAHSQISKFNQHTDRDGLGTNQINAIDFDSKGFLWVGTYNAGLYKFDGNKFTEIIDSNYIIQQIIYLYIDKHDSIFISDFDIIYIIYNNKIVRTINYFEDLNCGPVSSIIKDNNENLWIATNKGEVICYKNNKPVFIPLPETLDKMSAISKTSVDKNGNIWFSSYSGSLFYYDIKQKKIIDAEKKYGIESDDYNSLFTYKNKLIISNSDSSYILTDDDKLIPFSDIIFYVSDNNHILGMSKTDFIIAKLSDKKVDTIQTSNFDNPTYKAVAFSNMCLKNNNIYLATNRGLFEIIPKAKCYNGDFLKTNSVNIKNFVFADNKIWLVGYPFGYIENNKFTKILPDKDNDLYHLDNVEYAYHCKNKIYFYTTSYNKCFRYDIKDKSITEDLFLSEILDYAPSFVLLDDKQNNMWCFANGNIIRISDTDTTYFSVNTDHTVSKNSCFVKNPEIDVMFLDAIIDNDKNIWIGAVEGLWKYDGSNFKYFTDTLTTKGVFSICCDTNGIIWMSNYNFFMSYNPKTNTIKNQSKILETCQMPPFHICWKDKQNNLYISNLKLQNTYDTITGFFDIMNTKYYKNIYGYGYYTFAIDNDNCFWAGIENAAYKIPLSSIKKIDSIPDIYIKHIEIETPDGTRYFYPDNNNKDTLILSANEQNIKIYFEIPFFETEHSNLTFYHSFSENNKTKWTINKNNDYQESYTFIPNGTYSYKIKYKLNNSDVFSEIRDMVIIRQAHFYETLFFKIITILFILLLSIILIRNYIKRIKEKEKQKMNVEHEISSLKIKALQAQMNPHFIFNTLNSIQYLLSEHQTNQASNAINVFSKLIRKTLDFISQDHISLIEEIEYLKLYINIEKIRFSDEFKYKIEIDENIDTENTLIPPLIIQAFVENAIKHGLLEKKDSDKNLSVSFTKQANKQINIIIEDNGTGFDTNNLSFDNSHGISIIKQRLDIFINKFHADHDLKIDSKKNQGTKISLTIPEILKYD